MKILITGPQGSGKTTQAEILAKKLNLPFIGAGELLRQFVENGGEGSASVKADLEDGELVDNNIIAQLMKSELSKEDCQKGFVIDGYPRAFSQLQLFAPEYDQVFYLKLSDEEAKKRLLLRGREDDNPEAIEERLKWYHEETRPVLEYYQQNGKLTTVDGDRSVKEVAAEIEGKLKVQVTNE